MKSPILVFLVFAVFATACWDDSTGPREMIAFPSFDTTFVFPNFDLNADSLRPIQPPPPEKQVGDLLYRAEVVPRDAGYPADSLGLLFNVYARNPTDEPVSLALLGCPVWPRAYSSPTSNDYVWGIHHCAGDLSSLVFEPGAEERFSHFFPYSDLADLLPDGRYYFDIQFRRQASTVQVGAGSADVLLDQPGLEVSIRISTEDPGSVRAVMQLSNRGQQPIQVAIDRCSLFLNLNDEDAESWRWSDIWLPANGCGHSVEIVELEPEGSRNEWVFEQSYVISSLLDVGVEPGRYDVNVGFKLNWRQFGFPVGKLEF